jgi:hypothetical protein
MLSFSSVHNGILNPIIYNTSYKYRYEFRTLFSRLQNTLCVVFGVLYFLPLSQRHKIHFTSFMLTHRRFCKDSDDMRISDYSINRFDYIFQTLKS